MTIPATLRTWAEIRLDALQANARFLTSHTRPRRGLMAVVKADAYGLGARGCVEALKEIVPAFAVASSTEAAEIADIAGDADILILSPALPAEYDEIVHNRWVATVSSLEEVHTIRHHVTTVPARLHVCVDTGMGRIGVWKEEADALFDALRQVDQVEVHSISTHLPSADDDPDFTRSQLVEFDQMIPKWIAQFPAAAIHATNSAGAMRDPQWSYDYVRAGLSLFGVSPLPEFQSRLREVVQWKARVTLVRDVGAGRSVGYGRTFVTPHPMRLATLAVGYADGFPRQASGRGAQVLIGGKRCAVVGRVTMDQIVVDVSAVGSVHPGDEAVLVGSQGGESITATELAEWGDTIAWDILSGMGRRVARVHGQGGA